MRQILSFSRAAGEMSLSRVAAIADAMRTESGALRVVGASARATELDIETSRRLVFPQLLCQQAYGRKLGGAFGLAGARSAGALLPRRIV